MLDNFGTTAQEKHQVAVARQEIEYLRRMYGRATDQLGQTDDAVARAEAIATYRRIFAPEANIRAGAQDAGLNGQGPDAWVDVVTEALRKYETTQHLIGTQLVSFNSIEFDNGEIASGSASMTSYLHAWHASTDNSLRVVLGTYADELQFMPGIGWQIVAMNLIHNSADHRMVGIVR